jgi:hypothetical protein
LATPFVAILPKQVEKIENPLSTLSDAKIALAGSAGLPIVLEVLWVAKAAV